MKRFLTLPAAIVGVGLLTTAAAQATVYQNSNDASSIFSFGNPDTTAYGEEFIAPGGALQSLTYTFASGSAGNLELVVAAWNGTRAVGPALYTSGLTFYNGSPNTPVTWSGINLSLTTAASYIAFVTVAVPGNTTGNYLSGATSGAGFLGSSGNGGLGGAFYYTNSTGVDPLTQATAWSSYFIPDLLFSATFGPAVASVPEPMTLSLFGAGLVGAVAFRRRKKKA